jgi:hypothetical protein
MRPAIRALASLAHSSVDERTAADGEMIENVPMSHQHHTFHNPPPATPADVRTALESDDVSRALNAMVGCGLYGDGDWRESQNLYLLLLDHDDPQVQTLAATCLGHLARVCGQLDEDRVVAALRQVRARPHVRGPAGNALEDIEAFLHPRRARWRGRLWRLARPWTWF